jgi:alkylhydroperoxidase family enzyme
MSERSDGIARHAIEFRAVLGALGGVQLLNGIWATLAPSSFYGDFPFGRGWVEALPAYNEHLMRDVGGLFLATGLVLVVAAISLERRLVLTAIWSYLLFAIPHAIFHYFNLEPYGTGDTIGNVIALAATVLLPIWLLFRVRSGAPAGPAPRASATPANGNARITGVPEDTRNLLARIAYRQSRRRFGTVLDPIRIFAHHPKVFAGYGAMETAAERSHRVPERLKLLAELRAGMVPGCEWCCDFGSSLTRGVGISEEELRELPTYAASERFSDLEKLVMDYATGMSRSPVEVPDELFARLREHFDAPQLVELTNIIALENYRARFNWAFGIGSQGFAEGSFCVRPDSVSEAANA